MGCHALLQGIFPTQGSKPGLVHCRQNLYCLSHQGSPIYAPKSDIFLMQCPFLPYQFSKSWHIFRKLQFGPTRPCVTFCFSWGFSLLFFFLPGVTSISLMILVVAGSHFVVVVVPSSRHSRSSLAFRSTQDWLLSRLAALLSLEVSLYCFLYHMHAQFTKYYPILCDPTGCGPPDSPVHGISQTRTLE